MAAANVQRQEGVLGEWGHDTADRRPLDLLVAQARGAKATRNDGPSIPGDFKVGNNITWRLAPPTEVAWDTISHPLEGDLKLNITHVIVLIFYLGILFP